jgi:micrococcal nuclease
VIDDDSWDEAAAGPLDESEYLAEDAGLAYREVRCAVPRRGRTARAVVVTLAVLGVVLLGLGMLSGPTTPGPRSAPGVVPLASTVASATSTSSAIERTARPTEPAAVASARTARPTTAAPRSANPVLAAQGSPAVVISVVDGDTIHARIGGKDEKVRIIGLDSPESQKPGTQVECFAAEASAAAKRLLRKGSHVTLQPDPTQDTRDRFGRLLAHVILADGTLFAEHMIRDGYAVHYVYDGVPSMYADRLAAAQEQAEAAEAGLWSPSTCSGSPHAPSEVPD